MEYNKKKQHSIAVSPAAHKADIQVIGTQRDALRGFAAEHGILIIRNILKTVSAGTT